MGINVVRTTCTTTSKGKHNDERHDWNRCSSVMRQTRCIDCNALGRRTSRSATYPGPRCLEHHREQKRAASKVAHGKRIEQKFDITEDIYDDLYEAQGGRCFGCGRSKGKSRRLAIDHEHNKAGCEHLPEMGCRNCIRALLCAYCNEILGRLDADALRRLIMVLEDPPAQRILRAIMAFENDPYFMTMMEDEQ